MTKQQKQKLIKLENATVKAYSKERAKMIDSEGYAFENIGNQTGWATSSFKKLLKVKKLNVSLNEIFEIFDTIVTNRTIKSLEK